MGEKIKKYLTDNGIKQTFLAQKIGVSDPVLSDMLSGQRKIYADEYYLICKALRVSLEYFFESDCVES